MDLNKYRKYKYPVLKGSAKNISFTSCSSNIASNSTNIVHKLINRQVYGKISRKGNERCHKMFENIPPRLRFCLKNIVPLSYMQEHIFMGFTQCGQFLLSYTCKHSNNSYFKDNFTLHFMSWVPGSEAKKVHKIPLFGGDCVDSEVVISMAQWKHNPSLLIVYAIATSCLYRSYLSIIGVPRLGCKKCAAYSREEDDLKLGERCLEHNFAIHTKFFCTSDLNNYEPVVQLAYSNQIIIYTDFIHILEVNLVNSEKDTKDDTNERNPIEKELNSLDTNPSTPSSDVSAVFRSPKYENPAVQTILADFSDLEMENVPSIPVYRPDVNGQELCIQAPILYNLTEEWEGPSPSIRTLISPPLRSPRRRPAESMSRFNESHRIKAEKAYEFVDDTEKCEKISTYRKRLLADKKYAFSEDNSENIVPFRVLRSRKYFIGSNKSVPRLKSPIDSVVLRAHNRICSRPSTSTVEVKSPLPSTQEPECNSEIEYRVMEMLDDGSLKTVAVHDNASKTLSEVPISPQDPYLVHSENSKCSKTFTTYFVESDDEITSIITESEDDCLSGYHVALHLTAHGACYAPLQAVGPGAWDKIRSNPPNPLPPLTIRVQQRSLDTELLCNEVCGRLCQINCKKFIYCFDWGCHVIDVCQSSGCLSGVCAMWMWASEDAEVAEKCEVCRDVNADCLLHRTQYAVECLFVWDLVSGVYRTEKVSMTEDPSPDGSRASGVERARALARRLGAVHAPADDNRLLTVDTGKSLKKLTDIDNCIEITKDYDSSESDTDLDLDEDSN